MPLHATNRLVGRDFRGRALILQDVTTLSALAFSLINSTRSRQDMESRVCGYRPGYTTHLGIHKGQAALYTLSYKRGASRARTHPSVDPFNATYIHVTPVPIT